MEGIDEGRKRQSLKSFYLVELFSTGAGASIDTFFSAIVGTDVEVLIVSATE